MPRQVRMGYPGAIYHVMSRGTPASASLCLRAATRHAHSITPTIPGGLEL